MIIGNLLGQFCAITFQWFKYIKKELKNKRSPILQTLKKYKHYPKYLIPGTSAGTLAKEAPTFLLSKLFDASYAGFFSLVNRVTSPLSIVISAITEVYNVNAVRLYRENGECKSLYLQTMRNLASITIIPSIILLFWGPTIFTFVFGDQWTQAGVIARYFSFLILPRHLGIIFRSFAFSHFLCCLTFYICRHFFLLLICFAKSYLTVHSAC